MRQIISALLLIVLHTVASAQQASPQEQIQVLQQMLGQATTEKFQLLIEINRLQAENKQLKVQQPKVDKPKP